jgi:hypothetical protein
MIEMSELPEEGDAVQFEKFGETYEGEVVDVSDSGVIRVRSLVYVDVGRENIVEILDEDPEDAAADQEGDDV